MKTVITFGTFDLFHMGHLRILERARALGERLVVGISTDALTYAKKKRTPIMSETARKAIVSAIRYVDEVFDEEALDKKKEYIERYDASVLVMGDDWKGKFDGMPCEVVYLSRTPSISTTALIEKIITGF